MQYKKDIKQPKKELTFTQTKINRNNIIAESKDSVLIEILGSVVVKPFRFWIQKKYVFPSDYTLQATISIVPEWEYKYKDISGSETVATGTHILQLLGE